MRCVKVERGDNRKKKSCHGKKVEGEKKSFVNMTKEPVGRQ